MNPKNPKLQNVETAFDQVAKDGTVHKFHGEPEVSNMVQSHVQGIGLYNDYLIVTHNNKGHSKGLILVLDRQSKKLVKRYETHDAHYNHPGGLQVIGDYLAIAIENSSYNSSYIHFYLVGNLTDKDGFDLQPFKIERDKKGAGGVGVTNYKDNGVEYCLVGVLDSGNIDFYRSNGVLLDNPACAFGDSIFTAKINQSNVSGIGLVTDQNENVFVTGFGKDETWDQAFLYRVDLVKQTVTRINMRHMVTKHGGVVGDAGVHFRWGAGLQIISSGLKFLATQRNFVGDLFYTNTFMNT